MSRKVYEVMFSLMLEDKFSKDQILEMYFNTTYFATAQPASLPLHAVTSQNACRNEPCRMCGYRFAALCTVRA